MRYVKGQRVRLNETDQICGVKDIINGDKLLITILQDKLTLGVKVVNVDEVSPFICEKYGKECDFIMPASLIKQNMCDMCDIPEVRENMKSMVDR
jgi:hypothetical protein